MNTMNTAFFESGGRLTTEVLATNKNQSHSK